MKVKLFIIYAVLACSVRAAAQQPAGDPIGDNLFPPELVMQHQEEIGLTDEQRNMLKVVTRKAQTRFTELQWQLQDEAEKMAALIKQPRVDEQQALSQLDKILDTEREIKRLQISMVIQIKNSLTSEQQGRLMEIKNKSRR